MSGGESYTTTGVREGWQVNEKSSSLPSLFHRIREKCEEVGKNMQNLVVTFFFQVSVRERRKVAAAVLAFLFPSDSPETEIKASKEKNQGWG